MIDVFCTIVVKRKTGAMPFSGCCACTGSSAKCPLKLRTKLFLCRRVLPAQLWPEEFCHLVYPFFSFLHFCLEFVKTNLFSNRKAFA